MQTESEEESEPDTHYPWRALVTLSAPLIYYFTHTFLFSCVPSINRNIICIARAAYQGRQMPL